MADRRVTCFYFYLGRRLRACVHHGLRVLPLPGKVWVNGHEWAKRQATAAGIAPTLTADGRRAPALRFGDPPAMALLGALCFPLGALGFTHRSLRARVSHLLGAAYNTNQMSYDLALLRINALIERREHTNTYDLTPDGQRVAVFYTTLHDRLLRPLLAADRPPAPAELRQALTTIDRHVHDYIDHAQLGKPA